MRSSGARAVVATAPDPPIAVRCKENSLRLSHALADHGSKEVAATKGWDERDMRSGILSGERCYQWCLVM